MPNPDRLNDGIERWAVSANGGAQQLAAEAYYDNATPRDASQPIIDVSGLIENGQTRNRAMRVWAVGAGKRLTVELTHNGVANTVDVPVGTDMVTPSFTRTAAQLAALGITTRGDLWQISVAIVG